MNLLGWIPFIEPANWALPIWQLFAIPMALGVSIAYKSLHVAKVVDFWKETLIMSLHIFIALLAFSVALAALNIWVIPTL